MTGQNGSGVLQVSKKKTERLKGAEIFGV